MVHRVQVVRSVPAWCTSYLERVASIATEGLVVGKTYYAAFFAGRRGPSVLPPEIEVLVPADAPKEKLQAALEESEPSLRFRLIAAAPATGTDDPWWFQELSRAHLIAGCGGLCLRNGLPTLYATHRETARHLQEGILVPHGDPSPAGEAEATQILSLYPGLKAPFLQVEGKSLHEPFEEIHRLIQEGEFGGFQKRIELLPEEREFAAEVHRWHAATQPMILPLAMPPRAKLPDGDPWTAPDAEFREWLLDQTLLEGDRAPKDLWLMRVLNHQRGEQKPSHQGWEVYQHAISSMLVLETDHIPVTYRRALRVTMAPHDVGKLHNVWTPGCHALVGAKI